MNTCFFSLVSLVVEHILNFILIIIHSLFVENNIRIFGLILGLFLSLFSLRTYNSL